MSTCFGLYDEQNAQCVHCVVSRQCKSVRLTHGEELEAAALEELLADVTQEEMEFTSPFNILTTYYRFTGTLPPPDKPFDPDEAPPVLDPNAEPEIMNDQENLDPTDPVVADTMIGSLRGFTTHSACTPWEKDFIDHLSVNVDKNTGKRVPLTPARVAKIKQLWKKFKPWVSQHRTQLSPNRVID